jgi:hypothetical protein
VKATINNRLRLTQISDEMRDDLIQRLQLANPKYLENQRMGRWNRQGPTGSLFRGDLSANSS